jgi:predicted Fe-S protein YdhL (DUF1289 family)
MDTPPVAAPASPCIKVCKIDPRTGWCIGCLRTGAEIGAWPGLRPEAKVALLRLLEERRRRGGNTSNKKAPENRGF